MQTYKNILLPHLHGKFLNKSSLQWFAKEINSVIKAESSCCITPNPRSLVEKFQQKLGTWLAKPEFFPMPLSTTQIVKPNNVAESGKEETEESKSFSKHP